MLNIWNKIEEILNSFLPGYKTYITTGLGAIGSLSVVLQDYLSGIPAITQYLEPKTTAIISAILFTLSFWFKNMGDRVDARKDAPAAA